MSYVYLKDIFSVVLPLFLINLFFQNFYQTNLLSVTVWWFKHFFKVEYKGAIIIGLLFMLFALWVAIGSIIQTISLSFYSDTHKMMYVGNTNENASLLYHAEKLDAPPITYSNLSVPSGSFKSIYKTTEFLKDKNTDRLGAPSSSYSLKSIFTITSVMLAFTPLLLAILHTCAYPVTIQAEMLDYDTVGMREAFDAVYAPYGITPIHMLVFSIVMFLSLFFMPSVSGQVTANFDSKRAIELPLHIQSNAELRARPVFSFREIIDSMDNSPDIDTGFRTIIFKFENDFPVVAYVSYKYDSKVYPELEKQVFENIKNAEMMSVKVLDDLSIELIQ